jgi:hypothetical protein
MKFKKRSDKNRKLQINLDLIQAYASRYLPETEFEIEVTRRKKTISDPMRRWYFREDGVIKPLMKHLGYDPEDMLSLHRYLKILYFNVQPDKFGHYPEKDIPSVFGNESKMPVDEKRAFVDWVLRKAADQGCYIDNPQS